MFQSLKDKIRKEFSIYTNKRVKRFVSGKSKLILEGSFDWYSDMNLAIVSTSDNSFADKREEINSKYINEKIKRNDTITREITIGELIQLEKIPEFRTIEHFTSRVMKYCSRSPKKFKHIIDEIKWARNLPPITSQQLICYHRFCTNLRYDDVVSFLEENKIEFGINTGEYTIYKMEPEKLEELRKLLDEKHARMRKEGWGGYTLTDVPIDNYNFFNLIKKYN